MSKSGSRSNQVESNLFSSQRGVCTWAEQWRLVCADLEQGMTKRPAGGCVCVCVWSGTSAVWRGQDAQRPFCVEPWIQDRWVAWLCLRQRINEVDALLNVKLSVLAVSHP